ncbi:DNA-directed DNA polymerase [Coniosporium tulheliwenetii]|uniref:DNA-directed DNA polymerase n=1 Tax=Coniosporium tulheliwenetii TaxID=3383036 RepID=A0ACC2ZMT4_9PEZI|nr:DNA-directed DNA polymerase [Cladosporium sp. JES 115]
MSRKRRRAAEDDNQSANAVARKRQYTEEDAKLAKIYEHLASEAETDRIEAAKELISRLDPGNSSTSASAEKILRRLIRGLCSGRKAARLGYGVALAEVLRKLYGPGSQLIPEFTLTAEGLLSLIVECTKPEAKAAGQEKRDHIFGRLFAWQAVLRSSISVQSSAPEGKWINVLDLIGNLALFTPWLREECGKILYEFAESLNADEHGQRRARDLMHALKTNKLEKTPEGVAVWLSVRNRLPDSVLPEDVWHKKDPLCTKERRSLAKVMKGDLTSATDHDDGEKKPVKSGASQSHLHFAWLVVINAVIQKYSKHKGGSASTDVSEFSKFWDVVIDDNLFSSTASHERKSWGFQLFSKMLLTAPGWVLPAAFSQNLMRSLINQINDKERYLHSAAEGSLKAMKSRVSREPELATAIIAGLLSEHGSINFDKVTKTKAVENIMALANADAMVKLVPLLCGLMARPGTQDEREANSRRQTLADLLVAAVKTPRAPDSFISDGESWRDRVVTQFVTLAYFVPTKVDNISPSPPVSDATRAVLKVRLKSCLKHILAAQPEDPSPHLVVNNIRNLSLEKTYKLATQPDEETLKVAKQAYIALDSISQRMTGAGGPERSALQAFRLLYSFALLELYNGEPDAVSILEELQLCYQSTLESKKAVDTSFDLLLEILLSLVSKPQSVFRAIAEQISWKRENLAGQQELFDQAGSEMDEDEDEAASDVEIIEGELESGDEDEGESSDAESSSGSIASDDDSDGGSDGSQDEVTEFERKLAETLKTSKFQAGDQEDGDSDEDDGSDMDDDQMFAIEPALAKVMAERKKLADKKKEGKGARETVVNFKNRVLDLLSIFVKQQHANPLALEVILPLLRLIRSTPTKQLADKASGVLGELIDSAKKKGLPTPPDDGSVWTLLKDVHTEVSSKDASKLHLNACSRGSIFIAKVLIAQKDSSFDAVVDIYADTAKKCRSRSRMAQEFFVKWDTWWPDAMKQK